MQHLILALAFLFTSVIMAQSNEKQQINDGNSIKVSVLNALNDNGKVGFALYTQENFMRVPVKATASTISDGVSEVVFENIPAGTYAIVCFHDENDNGQIDFQQNGMPKESFGTSNNAMSFGPPQFDNSKFEVKNEDISLEIKF